jgi:signal transduction histidine kinase
MRAKSRYLAVALVAAVAALIAVYATGLMLSARNAGTSDLHEVLHREIDLNPDQQRRIATLESEFAHQRRAFDDGLRDANAEIATAYRRERAYGPGVSKAIDHSHLVMGDLQKLTLRHVLAMRAVLTPAQAKIFDRQVVKALTTTPAL